jgi:Rieske Fe-S protein
MALADLTPGERIVVQHGEIPVEIVRSGEGVVARSLLCTHQGCRVTWDHDASEYFCPCHEARFDAEGRPVFGPANRPLTRLPVRTEGDSVVVLTAGA